MPGVEVARLLPLGIHLLLRGVMIALVLCAVNRAHRNTAGGCGAQTGEWQTTNAPAQSCP